MNYPRRLFLLALFVGAVILGTIHSTWAFIGLLGLAVLLIAEWAYARRRRAAR